MNATQLEQWILDIAQTHTEKFRKSVLGCNIGNSLPLSIRYSKSLTQFKHWQNFLRNNILHLFEILRIEQLFLFLLFFVFLFAFSAGSAAQYSTFSNCSFNFYSRATQCLMKN